MTRSRDLADSADKDITGTLTVDAAIVQGDITVTGTVDGIDIATRDAILTSTTTTAGAALPKAGGTMSGAIAMGTAKITGAGNPTAAQDVATKAYVDSASGSGLPLAGGAMTGAITTNSTFDGVDVATRDAVLTSTTTTANAALPKAGGALTGAVTTNSTFDGRDVAADGVTADAALPKAGGAMTGAITTNSTFDGVDIATRDGVLTTTTNTANAALPKAGGALTGVLTTNSNVGIGLTPSDTFGFGKALDIGSAAGSFIYVRDTDATNAIGGIGISGTRMYITNKAAGPMTFQVNGDATERMRIDSNGDVGIGATDPGGSRLYLQDNHTNNVTNASTLIGNTTFTINGNSGEGSDVMRMGPMSYGGGSFIDVSNGGGSAAYPLIINPFSGGNILQGTTSAGYPVYGDNFTVASPTNAGMTIRSGTSNQGTLYFSDAVGTASGTYAGAVIYTHNNDKLALRAGGSDRVVISAAGTHFTQGIFIGGTGAANQLDDYEEGNHFPQKANGGTVSYGSGTKGHYTKVGELVTYYFDMSISAASGESGSMAITLPFAANAGDSYMAFVPWIVDTSFTGSSYKANGFINGGANKMLGYKINSGNSSGYGYINNNVTGRFSGVFTYFSG